MKIAEIAKLLGAEVLTCPELVEQEINSACASDMMSDVLAFVKDHGCLLTGLNNPQVIRTAEMMDMHCVIFCRGKKPDSFSRQLATQKGIVLLQTDLRMFQACGTLWAAGLTGGDSKV
jgi:predicted transcriptional regulator